MLCLGLIQTILYVLEARSIDMVRSWRIESLSCSGCFFARLDDDNDRSEMLDKSRQVKGKFASCSWLSVL